MTSKIRDDRTVIYCIYFLGFMDLFSVSMGLPLFTRRARELRASPSIVGLIGSIYGGIQFFSSPIMGKYSDTGGRTKVFVISLLGTAVGYFLIGLADSLLLFALARIPIGIFKQTQSMCKACLADVTAPIERPKVFGNFNAICSLGFVVGPLIGGHLAMTENGFFRVMTLQSLMFVFMAAYAGLYLKIQRNRAKEEKDKPIETQSTDKIADEELKIHGAKYTDNFVLSEEKINEIQNNPKPSTRDNTLFSNFIHFFNINSLGSMVDLLLLRFMLGFSVILYRSNFITMLEYRYQTTPKTNGYIMSYNGIISGSAGVFVGYIMSFYNHKDSKALLHFAIMLTACIFCVTYSPELWVSMLFIVPLSFSTAVSRVCITNMTLTRGHEGERGVLLGVGSSLLSFARMLSPLIGGLVLEFSVYGPGTISVIIACIAVGIAAFTIMEEKEKVKKQ